MQFQLVPRLFQLLQFAHLRQNVVILSLFAIFNLAAFAGVALSQETAPRPAYVDNQALDELFAALAEAPNQASAIPIANQIWQIWLDPDLPELADLMGQAADAQRLGDVSGAIQILDIVVSRYPDYAEGWNRRATLYFLVGNFAASFADVEEVLAREPRHFGALTGKAIMHLQQGDRAEALQAILRALRYYPFLSERAMFEELLAPPTQT